MRDHVPSLDLLLNLVQAEREKQLAHFDALDAKAGVVLGFAGLLITFAPEVPGPFRLVGVVAGSLSAALALWAFWPRGFPVLQPSELRRYLRAEVGFTRLTVLDTLEDAVNASSRLLRDKGSRLRRALVALALSAGAFSAGIVATVV